MLLSGLSSVYILDTTPLFYIWLLYICSHLVGGLFYFINFFFSCADAFEFDVISLVDFCCCDYALIIILKDIIAKANIDELLPSFLLGVL